MRINWYYILLQVVVFIWGFTGILGKAIGSNVINVLVYRTFITAAVLWLLFFILKYKIPNKELLFEMFGTGFAIACAWICFFESARLSNISISVIGIATSPIFVVIIQSFFAGKRNKKLLLSEFFLGILSLIGVYIIAIENGFHYWIGLLISMGSGVFSALYSIQTEKLSHKANHLTIVAFQISTAFWVLLGTLIIMQNYFPTTGFKYESLNAKQWFFEFIFAVFCTALPMTLSAWIMKKVSAFAVTLSVNIEPIYTILWAIFFFPATEIMPRNFYYGVILLISSVVLYPFVKKYFDNNKIVRHSVVRAKYIKRKYTKRLL